MGSEYKGQVLWEYNIIHVYHRMCYICSSRELVEHELVVATPHLGASTAEAQVKVAREIAQSFVDAKQGRPLQGVVGH